ncbi:hypothetical protein AB6E06_23450 [Vibrio splendidus]
MGRVGKKLKMRRIKPYLLTRLPKVKLNEPFERYKVRIPVRLRHMPDDVLEQWPFEVDVVRSALNQVSNLASWKYQQLELTSAQVLSIRHYPYDENRLFPKAYEWIKPQGVAIRPEWFNTMLAQGTFVRPIILAFEAKHHAHPVLRFEYPDIEPMFAPYHLLEGNRRLSLLRFMIENEVEGLKDKHLVWLVDMNSDN